MNDSVSGKNFKANQNWTQYSVEPLYNVRNTEKSRDWKVGQKWLNVS